jgi:predicted phosphodiesterase
MSVRTEPKSPQLKLTALRAVVLVGSGRICGCRNKEKKSVAIGAIDDDDVAVLVEAGVSESVPQR